MESNKTTHAKKAKKKQVKDELDRMKQAEKKRRRLEKALATSARIRSELEKKKQMKKEEEQRLDEEGVVIAEAVALHVLIEEEAEESLNEDNDELNHWQNPAFSKQDLQRYAFQRIRQIPSSDDGYGKWNHFGYGGWSVESRPSERSFSLPYLAGFSALQIGDSDVDTVFFNRF